MVKKKYFKKFIAMGLSAFMVMSSINYQKITVKATDENSTSDSEICTYEKSYGYIDNGYVAPRLNISESDSGLYQAVSIPAIYDSRDYGYITPVRNQGGWGTCWAFSAVAAMEASALSHKIADDKDMLDMSEYNVAYMAIDDRTFADPIGGTTGDNTYTDDMTTALKKGGNQTMVFRAMSKWGGMVDEEDCLYPGSSVTSYTYDASALKYILTGVKQINMADSDYVKKAIMENGAVSAYYYDRDNYAHKEYYYNYEVVSTNHAIAIVGWDDTVSRDKFKTTYSDGTERVPEGDGAWLIKNSWGEYSYRTSEGYMWISYYDVSLKDGNATYYEVTKADEYDYNYQYDGNTVIGYGLLDQNGNDYILADKYANVFTVKEGTGIQKLEAVAFGVKDANTSYSIQIYKNPVLNEEDENGNFTGQDNPESGTALLDNPITGKTTFAGYYTVNLSNTITLNEGDTFAVVISFDKKTSMDYSYFFPGTSGVTSDSNNNESYYSPSGRLVDMYEYYITDNYSINMCIKAFTVIESDKISVPGITNVYSSDYDKAYIEWQNVEGVDGYELFRSDKANGTYALIGNFTDTAYTDNSVEYGNQYYYKVRAYRINSGVKEYSDYSASKSVLIDIPVTAVNISYGTDNQINLSWNNINGAERYNVYKSTDNKNFTKVKAVKENNYTEKINYNEKTYYKVTSEIKINDVYNESMTSNTIMAYVKTQAPVVKMDTSSYGKVELKWETTSGTDVYRIAVYNEETAEYDDIKDILSTDKLEYTEDNLESKEGTTRKYKITTYSNNDGNLDSGEETYVNAYIRYNELKNLSYTLEDGVLKVIWDKYDRTMGNYGYYYIYSSDTKNGEYKIIYSGKDNSYVNNNYDNSKDLYIKVAVYGTKTGSNSYYISDYAYVTALQAEPLCIKGKNLLTGWQKTDGKWYYYNVDGIKQVSKWVKISGKWYYFDSTGIMQMSKWIGGKYYVKSDGTMAISEFADGGKYYVDADGKWVTGTKWLKVNGKWHYIISGKVQTSKWVKISNKWYYFNSNGIMQTSKWIDGKYYVKSDGTMAILEFTDSGKYYVDADGKWVTGTKWLKVNNSWYYIVSGQVQMSKWYKVNGSWYYYGSNGEMQKSKWISGKYYVKADGKMAISEWVDGGKYYVGSDGKWIKNYGK